MLRSGAIGLCAVGLLATPVQEPVPVPPPQPHVGVTLASRTVELGSARVGRIARVLVSPGDVVEAGQLIFELESEVERLEHQRLTVEASSTAALDLALARREKAAAEARRIAGLTERDIESGARGLDAAADLRIAEADVARAREGIAIAKLRRDEAFARLERLRGRSPCSGRVEVVHRRAGASVDQLESVVRIVAMETMRVEFPCPLDELQQWRVGDTARVRATQGDATVRATTTFVGRVADFASQTATVRLEFDNGNGAWLANQKVLVEHVGPASAPPAGRGR